MSVNRKVVVIYGSTDLWIYWDKADKLRLFYRDISHNLCAKRVRCLGNRNDAMYEIDTSALKYLSLSESCQWKVTLLYIWL